MFGGAKRLQLPKIAKCGTILFKITHPTSWTEYGGRRHVARHTTRKGGWTTRTQRAEQSKRQPRKTRKTRKTRKRPSDRRPASPAARDAKRRRNHKRVRFAVCVATPFSCRRPRSGPVAAALRSLRALRSNVVFFVSFLIFVVFVVCVVGELRALRSTSSPGATAGNRRSSPS